MIFWAINCQLGREMSYIHCLFKEFLSKFYLIRRAVLFKMVITNLKKKITNINFVEVKWTSAICNCNCIVRHQNIRFTCNNENKTQIHRLHYQEYKNCIYSIKHMTKEWQNDRTTIYIKTWHTLVKNQQATDKYFVQLLKAGQEMPHYSF